MERDRLGGVPYETKQEGEKIKLRFYPKGKNPIHQPQKNPLSLSGLLVLASMLCVWRLVNDDVLALYRSGSK